MNTVGKRKNTQGFTYLAVLFVVALLSLNLTLASTLYSFAQKREREAQLIFVGNQFKQAISSYYQSTPGTQKRYPTNLQELLQDNRFVSTRRHLRKIFIDPITHTKDWGLVIAPDGGVMGVYSLSSKNALKISGFEITNVAFEGKSQYNEWEFTYLPPPLSI